MNSKEPSLSGETVTVDRHQVNDYTRNGWVILSQFEEDEVETTQLYIPNPHPPVQNDHSYGHPPYQDQIQTQQAFKTKKHFFILGRSTDKTINQAREAARDANNSRIQTEQAFEQLQREAKAKEKEMNELSDQFGRIQEAHRAACSRVEKRDETISNLRLRIRAMEVDMGKIRKHIGDGAWNEVVGTKEEN